MATVPNRREQPRGKLDQIHCQSQRKWNRNECRIRRFVSLQQPLRTRRRKNVRPKCSPKPEMGPDAHWLLAMFKGASDWFKMQIILSKWFHAAKNL